MTPVPAQHPLRLLNRPWLILAITLAVTAVVAYVNYQTVKAEISSNFSQRAEQVRGMVHFRMQTYINALNQAKGFFVANDVAVSRAAFRKYVDSIELFARYPGIQGLGYTERIPAAALTRHEAEVRRGGFPAYRLWPNTKRAEYFAIVLLEPFDWRNRRAFGYDMFTEPTRRAAMMHARDTGKPAASGRVTLVQETDADRQAGFLIYVPLYRPDAPTDTVEARRQALVGFVYAPFRVKDLFRAAFAGGREEDLSYLRVRIYDSTVDANDMLYEYTDPGSERGLLHGPLFTQRLPLDIAGRTWSVEVQLLPTLSLVSTFLVPLLILGFGTALSFMLFRILRDVHTQRRMQQQLAKTRNLESIGLLAGGIAHDFNNILTAILGNISLARMQAQAGHKVDDVLAEAEKAFWRARDLTQQLLTFAKGGVPIKQTARLDEVVRDTASFALRGSNVRLDFKIDPNLWPAEFDPGQISQVINNLALNAKQAMPAGGNLTIAAENCKMAASDVFGLPAGRYLKLTVRDTGSGILPRHLDRIFDPYFTTKQGGTGLGLATSYSIIERHQGHIEVASTPAVGTTFTIYLPAASATLAPAAPAPAARSGAGTLLLMDDEAPIREVGSALLRGLGYEVTAVADGAAALAAYRAAHAAGRRFDAVILDLTVPGGMGGADCMRELLKIDADARGVVSSGYSNDPIMAEYMRWGFRAVVPKPYDVRELSDAIETALANRPTPDASTTT